MGRSGDTLIELEALREATRVRLTPSVMETLRGVAQGYLACGDAADRKAGYGLEVLLTMHDKLEAIRNGQG